MKFHSTKIDVLHTTTIFVQVSLKSQYIFSPIHEKSIDFIELKHYNK